MQLVGESPARQEGPTALSNIGRTWQQLVGQNSADTASTDGPQNYLRPEPESIVGGLSVARDKLRWINKHYILNSVYDVPIFNGHLTLNKTKMEPSIAIEPLSMSDADKMLNELYCPGGDRYT